MLRGLTTLTLLADDVEAARQWYVALLGVEPYFVRPETGPPAYVEFRLGDSQHELGLMDRRYAPPQPEAPGGVVAYWHVDHLPAALERALAAGATEYQPLTDREAGFRTAAVVDPFGNILGLMYNPHYLEMLRR